MKVVRIRRHYLEPRREGKVLGITTSMLKIHKKSQFMMTRRKGAEGPKILVNDESTLNGPRKKSVFCNFDISKTVQNLHQKLAL